jgi:hypothetical protein
VINLSYPAVAEDRYLAITPWIIGPFALNGKKPEREVIPIRSSLDSISGDKGIYHENSVSHTKVLADLYAHPLLKKLIPKPDTYHPTQVTWPCLNGTTKTTVTSFIGLAVSGGSGRYTINNFGSIENYLCSFVGDAYSFVAYRLKLSKDGRTIISGERNEYRYLSSSDTNHVTYTNAWYNYKPKSTTSAKLPTAITEASHSEILDILESRCNATLTSNMQTALVPYRDQGQLSLNTEGITELLYSFVVDSLLDTDLTVEETDFGELALSAAQQFDANQTNMIAFLRDLRNPKAMIPKLRNLSKLKTHSSNYLAVEYGVLPTISDLQNIVAAFNKSKPYFDRNGFKTYTSMYRKEASDGVRTRSIEQRIKLAIDDNDSHIFDLFDRMESAGFALNFRNIWDLIPYSFVIDWFLDVGNFLERVDTRLRLLRMNIRYTTMSRKDSISTDIFGLGGTSFVGNCQLVQYHRWTSDQCPEPRLIARPTFQDFNHWLESGALIHQRSKN